MCRQRFERQRHLELLRVRWKRRVRGRSSWERSLTSKEASKRKRACLSTCPYSPSNLNLESSVRIVASCPIVDQTACRTNRTADDCTLFAASHTTDSSACCCTA